MEKEFQQILEIKVANEQSKERLDKYLSGKLPSVTRSKIKKLIDENHVFIQDAPAKANHIVRPGENIIVHFPRPEKTDLEAENIPLDILYEDEFLLVVNKPAGLVVHPAYGNNTGTLVNALLYYCSSLSDVGGSQRPGLVHRLDKDTSGLIVIAKDDVTHVSLARQLQQYKIEREYRAIVWGHPKNREGRIEAPIARHHKERTKMMIHQEGKFAATNYKVLERLPLMSYMQLLLETGRTHQIRVHMASIGHPVFSDSTYGGRGKQIAGLNQEKTQFAMRLLKDFNRQMLHAKTLSFKHPKTKELIRFDSELPADMQQLLEILRAYRDV